MFMTEDEFRSLKASDKPWYCAICLSIKSNKIKWGALEGEEAIKAKVLAIYDEITHWRKNIFMLPRGKAGTDFIQEMTNLIKQFTLQ